MKNINNVAISGNVVRDAKFDRVCSFSIACNSVKKNSDGEYEEYPNFIDCVIFGKYGETMAKHLAKGAKVFVQGTLHQSRWEQDGNKRSKLEVFVDSVELASPKKKSSNEEYVPFD